MIFHNSFSKSFLITVIFFSFVFIRQSFPKWEEGMYPLSEINKLDLKKAGLKIDVSEVYNPNGISLVDALVNVGGCTGSFVSSDGLIITNHHCSFGAVQAASTLENNYLENGFVANKREEEIEAKGMICKIIDSYEDVSEKILSSVKDITDIMERNKIIDKVRKELIIQAEAGDKTIRAEIAEMFEGETYVLFKYKFFRDVRLVYVPPRSIGEFGGESDNWVWPRHTGDFSFLRVYTAPDGSSAGYSKENIPFKPKRYLKVNPNGVNENDFLFILGYPGRTFRHKPSQFLNLQEKYQLPFISEFYDFQIEQMLKLGENNPELALKFASRIKGLANTTKNYKGKILGLRRLDLVSKKVEEEKQLQSFIDSDPALKDKYGKLLSEIDTVYDGIETNISGSLWFGQIFRSTTLLSIANSLIEYSIEIKKPDSERRSAYTEQNLPQFKKSFAASLNNFNMHLDTTILAKLLTYAVNLPAGSRINSVDNLISGSNTDLQIRELVAEFYNDNDLLDKDELNELLEKSYEDLADQDNPVIDFVLQLKEQQKILTDKNNYNEGLLDKLSASLSEVKKIWKKTNFIPDANSTLRLTYGYVRGYSPADAVYYSPFTSLKGMIEKSYLGGDYRIPNELYQLYLKKDFGRFVNKDLNDVPVALIYNMDTTGGNSGSPILNANGEIIGVNYDRAYEATINDYAWSEDYSRSIGVDIRFVLWVVQNFGSADNLLKELEINN